MPEPVLVSIAAALAGRAVGKLYQLVREKFAGDPDATAALEAAEGAAADSSEVRELSTKLDRAATTDPEFAARLRAEWERVKVEQHAAEGGVTNQVSGQVSGPVVQARDIQGGIRF
ncbi:hypothetical protein SAMN05421810_107179 [Amycolatopsis arida]|uniref:Uncharacterized protein n=1 Tax=Amycolatopsis arida TaxID=587909 RepID=A0A1I5YI59_9PSEU|nr:hypothetical protein [Amycolatopsis arida]TDX90533.1 hypothetical protein CLV69_107179 [Amycolatopsis arida]SFQ43902.1 hypothetical protein SAMN05421810_107179 [Amycolatopsis arida]